MYRIPLLSLFGWLAWPLGALAAAVAGAGLEVDHRPNIVVILMDDLRWDELGCVGHPFVKTPHFDRIGREGAIFRNAFATTPLCSPSRASILTGLYPHAHGVTDNTDRSALSHRLVTFALLLHGGGYETGYVGKWHMGNDDSRRPGFDSWVSVKVQGGLSRPRDQRGCPGRDGARVRDGRVSVSPS